MVSFSALQRAEIAEILAILCAVTALLCFSALQRAEIAEICQVTKSRENLENVSVLFNEPKLLK